MSPEAAMRLMEAALFDGQAVLFTSLEAVPQHVEHFRDRVWRVTAGNLMDATEWILDGKGGLYVDPDKLLDAATVDKMIVVG